MTQDTYSFTTGEEPSVYLRVNAGGGEYVDTLGNTWEADQGYLGGAAFDPGTPVAGTEDDAIYQSLRYRLDGYSFVVPNGTYTVTLHFAEMYFTTPGSRVFDTTIEGVLLIDDLDMVAEAGPATVLTREFSGVAVFDGQLDIASPPAPNGAEGFVVESVAGRAAIACFGTAAHIGTLFRALFRRRL